MNSGDIPPNSGTQASSPSTRVDEIAIYAIPKCRSFELVLELVQRHSTLVKQIPGSIVVATDSIPDESDRLYFFYSTLTDSELLKLDSKPGK